MTDGRQKEGCCNGKEVKMTVVEPSMSTNKHMAMDITFLFAAALSTVFFIKVYYLVYQCVMYLLGCV